MIYARLLLSVACLSAFTGCVVVPLPHVTRKSASVSGKVVDGATGRPIEGAFVEVVINEGGARRHAWSGGEKHPGPAARTRADGEYHVGTGLNFHALWYANVSWQFHWPSGAYWSGRLRVKREGYSDLTTEVLRDWNGEYSVRAPDIRLVPISKKE
jgi:hypothetical protein